jgi:hypothetical protein
MRLALALLAASLAAEEPKQIPAERFDALHKMFRVQPEEQRFWRIPWTLSVGEARVRSAAAGKPILVWAGAGGAPIGVC